MRFAFEVGDREKHRVEFSFNQFFGNLSIRVDGQTVHGEFRFLSLSLVKRYELRVGQTEQHDVAIEKERKLVLAGFRKHRYRAFVDGKLVAQHEGF